MRATQVNSEVRIALEKVGVIFYSSRGIDENVYWSLLNNVHLSLIQGAREPYLGHKNIAVFKLQVSTVEPIFF